MWRKFGVVAFICFSLLGPLMAAPAEKKQMRFSRRTYDHCRFIYSESYSNLSQKLGRKIDRGTSRIYVDFEKPPMRGRPGFWLVSNDVEMKAVLKQKEFRLKKNELERALKLGTLRRGYNIVVKIPVQAHPDWILRLIFTEYAHYLIRASTPSARNLPIGWFYAGLAGYTAWKTVAESENIKKESQLAVRKSFRKRLRRYYAGFINRKKIEPLELLEAPRDWQAALARNPKMVYAQSVLSYYYLAGLRSDRIGMVVLRNYERENSFGTAFERAVRMSLKLFEKEIKENLYLKMKTPVSRSNRSENR